MRSSYGSLWQACLRKRKYTHTEAMRRGAKYGNVIYLCSYCGFWHLTTGPAKKRKSRVRKREHQINDPIKKFKRYGLTDE